MVCRTHHATSRTCPVDVALVAVSADGTVVLAGLSAVGARTGPIAAVPARVARIVVLAEVPEGT